MSVHRTGRREGVDCESPTPLETAIQTFNKRVDPFGIVASQLNAQLAWLLHPQELLRAAHDLSGDLIALHGHGVRRMLGQPSDDVFVANPDDTRFADPLWTDSATWDIAKEWYLAVSRHLHDMYIDAPGLSERERKRAAFWLRNGLNMVAPTNFFWLNPHAVARFLETRGESVKDGWTQFLRDLDARNILMVEQDAFTVGKDLATTPGKVIFRNRLMELIHYAPTTQRVRSMPIVFITPWINKFYILDLTEKKSMVKYLTDQGFSVFITSWKNPGSDMRDVSLDDYLLEGVNEAVRVATEFCNVPQVHLVGYCLGGTLVTIYMAWANKHFGADQVPVAHWTLFATLTDFARPGDIDVLIDEASINALEEIMAAKGYLDGSDMATSFRLLRSNSLIWNYWVQSYLLGEKLPRFDVLFWNTDTTRMPQAMHSYYLRQMYLHNNLIKRDHLTLGNEPIDLNRIVQPLYAVTAEDDHVAPWKQCYRIRKYVNAKTPVRFALSTSGHVLGIVNPPVTPPKRSYWIAESERDETWEQWRHHAVEKPGTWWNDWTTWLSARTGKRVPAYPAAHSRFPALADAPGTYVLEK